MNKNILETHMGDEFGKLDPLLQITHKGKTRLSGIAKVERGNFIAKIMCNVFGFPEAGDQVNLSVDCEHSEKHMLWRRNFDGLIMQSSFAEKKRIFS